MKEGYPCITDRSICAVLQRDSCPNLLGYAISGML